MVLRSGRHRPQVVKHGTLLLWLKRRVADHRMGVFVVGALLALVRAASWLVRRAKLAALVVLLGRDKADAQLLALVILIRVDLWSGRLSHRWLDKLPFVRCSSRRYRAQ